MKVTCRIQFNVVVRLKPPFLFFDCQPQLPKAVCILSLLPHTETLRQIQSLSCFESLYPLTSSLLRFSSSKSPFTPAEGYSLILKARVIR